MQAQLPPARYSTLNSAWSYRYWLDVAVLCLYLSDMGNVQDARQVIADAETSLRRLIEEAMREQRYADVAEVARLADALARVCATQLHDRELGKPQLVPNLLTEDAARSTPSRRAAPARRKPAFPRFERDSDTLVKVGWSKKNRTSYQHRAPKETVFAFLRHVSASVKPEQVFAVEDLMPVPDFAQGGEVPAYRVYLALAWLRNVHVIEKKGRNGYVFNHSAASSDEIQKHWEELPHHKATA